MRGIAGFGRALVGLGMACLVGCAPAAPTQAPAAQQPSAQPATTVPVAGQTQSDWDQVVAAAKQEGSVAVFGPDGVGMQQVLTTKFQDEYGITVNYVGDPGPGIPPRVLNERQAHQYLWDVYVGGTTTALTSLLPNGALEPADSSLILPDVKDPSTWRNGGLEYLGDDHQVIVMTPFQRGTIFVNTTLVDPTSFTSYKDLLDPKWNGKIVLDDPRKAGPGQATFTFFYLQPDLGPDFIRALGKQNLTVSEDYTQEVDLLGQGNYPILLGTADFTVVARAQQGVPVIAVNTRQLKEGSDVSPANGAAALFANPPHPNAQKVYLNWLLSKDEQTDFAQVNNYVSARLDVPTDFVPDWRVPLPGAIRTYDQQAIDLKSTILDISNEVLGPS